MISSIKMEGRIDMIDEEYKKTMKYTFIGVSIFSLVAIILIYIIISMILVDSILLRLIALIGGVVLIVVNWVVWFLNYECC